MKNKPRRPFQKPKRDFQAPRAQKNSSSRYSRDDRRDNQKTSRDSERPRYRADGEKSSNYKKDDRRSSNYRKDGPKSSSYRKDSPRSSGPRSRNSSDRRPPRFNKPPRREDYSDLVPPPVSKNSPENRVFGKNAVIECLNSDVSVNKIWMLDSYNPKLKEIEQIARIKKIPLMRSPRQELDRLAEGEDHRSIIAEISPVKIHDEDYLYSEANATKLKKVLIAVNIEDPHNLGAILRSSMAFGVDAVVFTARKSTQITSTVISSSAGAALKVPLVRISNTTDCVLRLKEHGYWIYGTCVDQDKSQMLNKIDFSEKSAILVGNEGKGLSEKVLKHCDFSVYIPVEFNSLNVSVATGIVLYQMSLTSKK